MRYISTATLMVVILGASGCTDLMGVTADCGSPDAQSLVGDIFREEIEQSTRTMVGENGGAGSYSTSKIRATAAQLKFAVADVRTTKDDPDSSKKFCTGTLKITVPAAVALDADRARTAASNENIGVLADRYGIDRAANAFSKSIEYSVQPTDEGDKLFAEAELGEDLIPFIAELLSAHLMSDRIEQAAAEQTRIEAEARALEQQAQMESEQALGEQKQAILGEAKAENDLARQTINAIWTSVPEGGWGPVLPLQRAWVRRKEADCKVEAASASLDPADREATRLRCDTRLTLDRIQWLRRNMPESAFSDEETGI